MPHRSVDWLLAARFEANCLDRPVTDPGPAAVADVVRRTAGLQAQAWRGAAYAVRARSTATNFADVSQAQEVDRSVIRGWFMRGTLQLVAVEDAGPLLGLLGPKLIKDTERRYGELGLTEAVRAEAADLLEEHLLIHGPTGRAELADVLVKAGLIEEPRGQAVYALIRHTGLLGRLCYGPGYDKDETWVAVRDWLGKPLVLEGDAEQLARRYLAAYGPATARDFATWSGLPVPAARASVRAVATESFEIEGDVLVAVEDLRGSEAVRLLGEFDAYLLGYQDRRQALAEEYHRKVFPGGGMLRPAVVRGGRVIGTWRHADRSYELFGLRVDLADELADVARFAG
ncbi:winged helix DNA-binding domain-containing protein [Kribbella sp. NBC_00889]|uniref:winged helix DNA-binding domain-containing protein n=1 Tax=Kribbella sp. NBC_00889 TaxID=2975974 RepID=UPI00386C2E2C|nr:winged helix DNA-binding domain-containing protein [Kribbella sp. NBC_00889]